MAKPTIAEMAARQFDHLPGLTIGQQVAFCIGNLIMEWANCEGLLLSIYKCLLPSTDRHSIHVTWFSFNSTRSRCDLLRRTAITAGIDANDIDALDAILAKFKTATTTRNLFCHGYYSVDQDTNEPVSVDTISLTLDEKAIKQASKKFNKSLVHELKQAIRVCQSTNTASWELFRKLYAERKPQNVWLRPLPDG